MNQLVTIHLFGQPYTFKSDAPADQAQQIADTLVSEVEAIQAQQTDLPGAMSRTAVLVSAALNIASENNELKEKHMQMLGRIQEKSNRLVQMLDFQC